MPFAQARGMSKNNHSEYLNTLGWADCHLARVLVRGNKSHLQLKWITTGQSPWWGVRERKRARRRKIKRVRKRKKEKRKRKRKRVRDGDDRDKKKEQNITER